jgi:hypothetical protein
MMNSVVTITKAEIANSNTARPCPADFSPGDAAVMGRTGDDIGKLLYRASSTRDEKRRRAACFRV